MDCTDCAGAYQDEICCEFVGLDCAKDTTQIAIFHPISQKKLAKADLELQEEWLTNTLPQLKIQVDLQDGVLLYEDEAVFQQSGSFVQTWARVGQGVEVKTEPVRHSAKILGAVDVTGAEAKFHYQIAEWFNTESFIAFLALLLSCYPDNKIFLVLDNVAYHKSKQLKEWLQDRRHLIELVFLPAYSPDFNATESVWRLAKRLWTHNRHFAKLQLLTDVLVHGFGRLAPARLADTVRPFLRTVHASNAIW